MNTKRKFVIFLFILLFTNRGLFPSSSRLSDEDYKNMKVAKGVKLSGLKIEMKIVLEVVEDVHQEYGKHSFITHTDDGVHSPRSLHPYGYAVDYRTWFFRYKRKIEIAKKIKSRLPPGFDVILHRSHLHVEWDDAKKLIKIGKL